VDGESFECLSSRAHSSLRSSGQAPRGICSIENLRQFRITTEHFSTLGIPIVRGRALAREDSRAAVISIHAARKLWPGEDPLGKRLVRHAPEEGAPPKTFEIVGVAGNPSYDSYDETDAVYVPLGTTPPIPNGGGEQSVYYTPTLTVRTESDSRALVPAIRSLVREVDPNVGIGGVQTLAERYASRTKDAVQSNAAAFGIGIVALLLASLGLYAIVAYSVAQRTREIGIRLAMGSTPNGIVGHFLRYGLRVSLIALAIGIPATVAGIRIVQANAVGFTLRDAGTVLIVVPVLIVVTLIACWLPARRAGRVDPLVALRTE
jgi:ABC-type antimicrobial peptide transport system permease subunit